MEKIEGVFEFKKSKGVSMYNGRDYSVTLKIDYRHKQFSIKNSAGGNDFKFLAGSENSIEMWNAIGELIIEATEFANQELFGKQIKG